MKDTIYREDAINALEWKWAGKAAFDAIKNLPSAQSGRYKWNPIKDGLPDEEGVYFVTDDAGGMATVYLDVFSHYEDGSPYWLYSQNVTAWMHTPEPYQEGDEE